MKKGSTDTKGEMGVTVLKNKTTGKWEVRVWYKDFTGERKQKTKRGFELKREAEAWERDFKLMNASDLNMKFGQFLEIYQEDIKHRVRPSTFATKEHIIRTKIAPYFSNRRINEITASDVIAWQKEIQDSGKSYSPVYLKTIHNQLSAIFNHAIKYYGLHENPACKAGCMGSETAAKEMSFWTKEEYLRFSEAIADKAESYEAFQVLYWTGMREGEMMALTPSDIDLEKHTIRINKQRHRVHGEDVISEPKTKSGNRTVIIPAFLADELENYMNLFYKIGPDETLFNVTKTFLNNEMIRGCKKSGVKRIRIHDIRHSHVSLLINMGFSALAIGERVGHEAEKITYRYAHLFPSVQSDMANKLDEELQEAFDVSEDKG